MGCRISRIVDSNDGPREKVKSKSWTEIIADQFSAVAWIKGLKIYLALLGIFSLLVYWSQTNPVCGVIGFILLIISYSLRVQESKVFSDPEPASLLVQESKVSSDSEEQSDSEPAPSSSRIGDSLRSATGVLLLLVGWGYLLYSLTKSGPYTEAAYNYETGVYTCHLMSLCAFRSIVLPTFILWTLPLTGLVYWKRASFFRNMRSKMYAREMVRYSFAFIYFLIFIFVLMYGFGGYDTYISVTVVALMSVFFLATPLIMIFPKFTPTEDDSKDAEFITFFILFTFLHFASFILAIAYLGSYYKSTSIIPILLFIGSLMVVFFYYNYLLDFVKKTIGKSDGKIDNSYNPYRQERHTGSLLYIGIVSLMVGLAPNGLVFLLVLFIALFGISYFKHYTTGTSDWDTPLGKISKYEFTLIAFNICILLTFIYFVHEDIGKDNDQYYQNECDSAKAGIYVRSYYANYRLVDCDLSYRDLSGANLKYAVIRDTSFNSTDLSGADFSFATMVNDVYFTNANLHGASLYQVVCDWRWSCSLYFTDADLSEADLRGADLSGANLLGADFRGATLEGANLGNSVIDENTLFSKNISGVNFEYVDFSNRNFSGYNLNGSSFSHAKLEGANFSGTYLVGVNFDSVDLSNRNFSGYDLSGASFNEANLSGVNLSETSLVGISAFNLLSCPSSLPTDWSCVGNNLIGPELNFTGINLNNANLSNANLYGSNFSSTVLTNTNLSNSNLSNSYFSYSNFDEINGVIDYYSWNSNNFTDWLESMDFDGDFDDYLDKIKADSAADLSNADLSNANLSGAILSYADLSNANLSNATLFQAELTGVTWYYTICPDGTNTGESGSCSAS